jgi:hypothetical protein
MPYICLVPGTSQAYVSDIAYVLTPYVSDMAYVSNLMFLYIVSVQGCSSIFYSILCSIFSKILNMLYLLYILNEDFNNCAY